jgi:C-terminal processing protease CtpA/Prc
MLRITKPYAWASGLACLAIAVAAAGAFAQEQQEPSQQQDQSQDQSQQYESQRQTSDDSQSQDQDRQRAQQERQRAQQDRQRAQQDRQRAQQQRDQDQWSQDREQWNRDQYSRDQDQWSRDREQQFSRDAQRSAGGGDEAGLGVSIARDQRGEGITVIRVHRGSPADEMGLREGDRITHLNGQRVQSSEQFISRIRNMDPGEEVELDVQRDSRERTFRGELESRRQALVLRGSRMQSRPWPEPSRDAWQTGYEEQRGIAQEQYGRGGEVDRQISQIERQLNQLSREVDELRFALREIRQQSARSNRETTARYDEYGSREGFRSDDARMTGRWQDEDRQFDGSRQPQRSYQDSQRQREFDTERGSESDRDQQPRQYDQGTRSRDSAEDRSIGGEIGEERTRTGSEINDRN